MSPPNANMTSPVPVTMEPEKKEKTGDWTREELEEHYVDKMTVTTLAVNVRVEGEQRILDMSELETLLRGAKRISQQECDCRTRMGRCIEPMTGCISLDHEADDAIAKGGREITVEEALKAMEETFDAGLVHMSYQFQRDDKPHIICSCCKCCCHSLSAAIRFGYSDHVIFSARIALQEPELCENCGACADRCHFEARTMDDDSLSYADDKCAGCGLCVSHCPSGAITMVDRQS